MTSAAYAKTVAGVPVLIAEPSAASGEPVPVVFWHHGFRADALAHAAELERCAAAGFLAIGVDAVAHGARGDAALPRRIADSPAGAMPVMLDIVRETLRELPLLLDALAMEFPIDRARVSMVGISMGAFLAYRAIVAGPPVRSVVALLGSPEWPHAESPHHSLHAFQGVAVCSITAERDVSVPPAPVERLHHTLQQVFPTSARHRHHQLRGAGHLTSADEWAEAMRETLDWLKRHG